MEQWDSGMKERTRVTDVYVDIKCVAVDADGPLMDDGQRGNRVGV